MLNYKISPERTVILTQDSVRLVRSFVIRRISNEAKKMVIEVLLYIVFLVAGYHRFRGTYRLGDILLRNVSNHQQMRVHTSEQLASSAPTDSHTLSTWCSPSVRRMFHRPVIDCVYN